MEDTRLFLRASGVGGPAHDGAVVHFRDGLVRQDRQGSTFLPRAISRLGHLDRLGRIVEGPSERIRRRVGIHFADHFRIFVPGHAVNSFLLRLARWFNCENSKRRTQSEKK